MTTPGAPRPVGIGAALRDARVRRGRSIGQAHQATRIARVYLEALEAEDWSALPAPPFARGFLSSYAEYLGLESSPLLARFPVAPTLPGAGLDAPADTPATDPEVLERTAADGLERPRVHLGPWLAAAVVVLVVIVGVVAVVTLRDPVIAPEEPPTVHGINTDVNIEAEAEAIIQRPEISRDPLPDLREYSAREAINYVQNTGAPFVVLEVHDETPAGTVIEQTPAGGERIPADGAVTLVLSSGPREGVDGTAADPADDSATDS